MEINKMKVYNKNLLSADDRDQFRKIICYLRNCNGSEVFDKPAYSDNTEWKNYLEIIKKPIDLSLIEKNLLDPSFYINTEEIYHDFQLIWDNCKKYNKEDSAIYLYADNLEKETDKLFKKYFDSPPRKSKDKLYII